jgi:hypothetical protein
MKGIISPEGDGKDERKHVKRNLGLALVVAACALPVRADLTWEHSGTAHFTGMKNSVFKFKLFTNMTPQRYRMMLKYDATAMGGALPPGANPMNIGMETTVNSFAPRMKAQTK